MVSLLDKDHLGGSLTEGLSPKTRPLSGAQQLDAAARRHSLGCDVLVEDSKAAVWSDLDMTCFSESDSERSEDRESRSYFKVENLGNGNGCFKTVVHIDSGCGECDLLTDVRGTAATAIAPGDSNCSAPMTGRHTFIETSASGDGSDFGSVADAESKPSQDSCLQGEEQVVADDSGFNGGTDEHII